MFYTDDAIKMLAEAGYEAEAMSMTHVVVQDPVECSSVKNPKHKWIEHHPTKLKADRKKVEKFIEDRK